MFINTDHHGLTCLLAEILDAEDVGESEEEEDSDEVEEEEEAEEIPDNLNPPSGISSAHVLNYMFA
jgi:hypothetical protein